MTTEALIERMKGIPEFILSKTVYEVFMSVLKHYFLSGIQKIMEVGCKYCTHHGDILMFHQVTNDYNDWDDPNCSITYRSFKHLIESLVVQEKDFSALEKISPVANINTIYITFDDAYIDVLTQAVPILVQHNIPFTVFISPGFLGKPKYLTIENLRELSRMPLCTIGAHTVSHLMLRSTPQEKASYEIKESGKILSDYIGKPVEFFAYPYGSLYACSKKNCLQVKSAGYKMGFSTLNCSVTTTLLKSKWFLPRQNVNEMNYLQYIKR